MNSLFTMECLAVCPEANEAARIAAERMAEIKGQGTSQQVKVAFRTVEMEGFIIEVTDTWEVVIGAAKRRDFIAGAGHLLELLLQTIHNPLSQENGPKKERGGDPTTRSAPSGKWEHVPKHPVRVHYMPGHFGNSFEVCWSGEMHRYLEDLALAGASGYGDWFDPNDMPDPYHSHVFHSSSMFLWRRKKEWLSYSQQLGLDNILVITPNVGFVDQMRPEWVGVRNHQLRVQGQVLCPSNPLAREVILQNQRNLFADLQQSGIRIEKIVCAPYDDGGCGCDKCQPYYPVFLALVHDVYQTIQPLYPELKVDICGWWTSEEESKLLQTFVTETAKDWFSMFQFSATYGVFALPDIRPQLGMMNLGCFLHIGFSNDRRDVYTKTGVHVAAERLQSVIRSFAKQECHGFMTYNESFGDHYNAFVTSQLGWNPDKDIREITRFYCGLILGVQASLDSLVDVMLDMQFLDETHAADWVETLEKLQPEVRTHAIQQWAFAHILLKAELMALDYSIKQRMSDNIIDALPDMETRLVLTERLWRHVYGFGVLRHILIPERMLPEWHKQYLEYMGDRQGEIQSKTMSKDA